MMKIEYSTDQSVSSNRIASSLEGFAKEGWELVSILPEITTTYEDVSYYNNSTGKQSNESRQSIETVYNIVYKRTELSKEIYG